MIASRHDSKLSRRLIPAFEERAPGFRCLLLDHGRHMLPLENADEVASFII